MLAYFVKLILSGLVGVWTAPLVRFWSCPIFHFGGPHTFTLGGNGAPKLQNQASSALLQSQARNLMAAWKYVSYMYILYIYIWRVCIYIYIDIYTYICFISIVLFVRLSQSCLKGSIMLLGVVST